MINTKDLTADARNTFSEGIASAETIASFTMYHLKNTIKDITVNRNILSVDEMTEYLVDLIKL